jgi:hypothetical protein
MDAKPTTQTSSTFLRSPACCHGYREVLALLYLSQTASAREQQARDEVGMSLPIAHGCAAGEGETRIRTTSAETLPTSVLDLIQHPLSFSNNI